MSGRSDERAVYGGWVLAAWVDENTGPPRRRLFALAARFAAAKRRAVHSPHRWEAA